MVSLRKNYIWDLVPFLIYRNPLDVNGFSKIPLDVIFKHLVLLLELTFLSFLCRIDSLGSCSIDYTFGSARISLCRKDYNGWYDSLVKEHILVGFGQ